MRVVSARERSGVKYGWREESALALAYLPTFDENAAMDYQITCVCGFTFQVPEQQILGGRNVICPSCHRQLNPKIEAGATKRAAGGGAGDGGGAGGDDAQTVTVSATAAHEETKRCPYCGEVILAVARKCKHCGEFLDRAVEPHPAGAVAPLHALPGAPASLANPAGIPVNPNALAPAGIPVASGDVPPAYDLSVSQWDNFWKFLILLAVVALVSCIFHWLLSAYQWVGIPCTVVVAGFVGWFFYLNTHHTRIIIRPTRIDTEEGILSKDIMTLELFRVTDLELKQGLIERLLGIGTIRLTTVDKTQPEVMLYQIPQVRAVYKYIQNQIPIASRMRGAYYVEK